MEKEFISLIKAIIANNTRKSISENFLSVDFCRLNKEETESALKEITEKNNKCMEKFLEAIEKISKISDNDVYFKVGDKVSYLKYLMVHTGIIEDYEPRLGYKIGTNWVSKSQIIEKLNTK